MEEGDVTPAEWQGVHTVVWIEISEKSNLGGFFFLSRADNLEDLTFSAPNASSVPLVN